MLTIYGEKLNARNVLTEYPRPQFKRDSYINLNGEYEYAVTKSADFPKKYDGKILVPFSPECPLSGVNKTLMPDEFLWYRREIKIPEGFNKGVVFLHFGAVDQICEVFIDGISIGKHTGGYLPFSLDITSVAKEKSRFELVVRVKDLTDTSFLSKGKQKLKRGQIWYSPQSGIWQTVWLESVPERHIESVRITPDFDDATVKIEVKHNLAAAPRISIFDGETQIKSVEAGSSAIKIPGFKPWTCENPFLYGVRITGGDDEAESYFGMRKVNIGEHNGHKCIMLNNRPCFNNGLLDQGYYSDGYLTPPSDEAMIFDISTAKSMGFNMLRKHIKIEPLRWYYHCDRLGMLVWQDMVNGGAEYKKNVTQILPFIGIRLNDKDYKKFAREDKSGRDMFYAEAEETVNLLYNSPSVIMWVPFNEGWGQFDAVKAYGIVKEWDSTRLIDHASGWHDQNGGDFNSRHIYFVKLKKKRDKLNRAFIISEFGGYSRYIDGHSFNEKFFGYKRFDSDEALGTAYESLYKNEVIPLVKKGLCATVYTQLTDVEDEVNGLITYDRKKIKLGAKKVAELNNKLYKAFETEN